MSSIGTSELIHALMGRQIAGRTESVFTGVSTDSRSVRRGDLFIALVGKRLDGHDFVSEAVRGGAAGVVVSRECSPNDDADDVVIVMVDDTTKALLRLAAWHRCRFRCRVAAVTGSNGKTTTKDLTWAILSRRYRTLRSQGSKNNHIGLPLTLLELNDKTEAAVLELGTSAFGEVRLLAFICQPDVGCITNVGPAHLEFFGSVQNVAAAKAELLEELDESSPVVLNADDEWSEWVRYKARGPIVTFGIHRKADFMAENVSARDGYVSFRLVANLLGSRRTIELPFPGGHNARNALAAAALSSQMGAGISEIEEGLAAAKLPSMRYEVSTFSGITVINDAYNANPVSMMAALSSFCETDVRGRRIFVCGDMLELGIHAHEAHREVGLFLRSKPIDYVIAFGELAPIVGKAAFGEGMEGEKWTSCRSPEEVLSVLKNVAASGDAVLIKGSRANAMERIVDALRAAEGAVSKGVKRT